MEKQKIQGKETTNFLDLIKSSKFGQTAKGNKRDLYCYQNSLIGEISDTEPDIKTVRRKFRKIVNAFANSFISETTKEKKLEVVKEFYKICGSSFYTIKNITNSENEKAVQKMQNFICENYDIIIK